MLKYQSRFFALVIFFSSAMSVFSRDFVFESDGSKSTLVELFSSEGCSSCPPAEAWITKFNKSDELWKTIFPVVFHVDYWDNLGWPDRFARAAYTQRQQDYAARLNQAAVYTPEFVVNGKEWRNWFNHRSVSTDNSGTSGKLTLTSGENGKKILVEYSPVTGSPAQGYIVNVALLGASIVSDVKRGENGGQRLKHDFVVLAFTSRPMTTAQAQKYESGLMDLTPSQADSPAAVVAWVTPADDSIAQVAGGWLRSEATQ